MKYDISYGKILTARTAETAADAIEKLTDQYGWSWKLSLIDAATNGRKWCEGYVDRDGGINYDLWIIAVRREK